MESSRYWINSDGVANSMRSSYPSPMYAVSKSPTSASCSAVP